MWYLLITDERDNSMTRRDLVDIVSNDLPLDHQLDKVNQDLADFQSFYYRFEKVCLFYHIVDGSSYTQFGLSVPEDKFFGSFYGSRSRKNPR